jgi:hypothetical protein
MATNHCANCGYSGPWISNDFGDSPCLCGDFRIDERFLSPEELAEYRHLANLVEQQMVRQIVHRGYLDPPGMILGFPVVFEERPPLT